MLPSSKASFLRKPGLLAGVAEARQSGSGSAESFLSELAPLFSCMYQAQGPLAGYYMCLVPEIFSCSKRDPNVEVWRWQNL